MYSPHSFREEDPAQLIPFIRQNSFGVLVSQKNGLQASHLPFLFEESPNGPGHLLGHLAQANDQWHGLMGEEVLVIFHGPQAYISPSWYEEVEVVPTWNYVAVHVYGKYVPLEEPDWTRVMEKMVHFYEAGHANPWDMKTLPRDFYEKLKQATRAFRIEVTRMEGKWKLSQNHSRERREKVIEHLGQGGPDAQAIAQWMKERLKP